MNAVLQPHKGLVLRDGLSLIRADRIYTACPHLHKKAAACPHLHKKASSCSHLHKKASSCPHPHKKACNDPGYHEQVLPASAACPMFITPQGNQANALGMQSELDISLCKYPVYSVSVVTKALVLVAMVWELARKY